MRIHTSPADSIAASDEIEYLNGRLKTLDGDIVQLYERRAIIANAIRALGGVVSSLPRPHSNIQMRPPSVRYVTQTAAMEQKGVFTLHQLLPAVAQAYPELSDGKISERVSKILHEMQKSGMLRIHSRCGRRGLIHYVRNTPH